MKSTLSIFLFYFVFFTGYSQEKIINNTELINLINRKIDSSDNFYNNGHYSKSLILNIKVLELAKKLNDPSYIRNAHRALGYDFMIVNDSILAKENFENAKIYAKKLNDNLAIGQSYMDLANFHSRSGMNIDLAFKNHDLSIEIIKKSKDTNAITNAHYNAILTSTYYKKYDKGIRYILALKDPAYDSYKADDFWSLEKSFLADYSNKKKNFSKAEEYARASLEYAEHSGQDYEKYDAYNQIAISLYGQHRYKEAYDNRVLSNEYITRA
ncbi:hypothetical protein SCB49_04885 [unidentified eubacterium SCB49]|nr:hypothetical protein SCB49_04885 [unidentified eubacterium SCB49]